MKKTSLFLTALCLTLTACVQLPKGFENERFAVTVLNQANGIDNTCQCQTARLGGKILNATALKNQTKVEVLSFPISNVTAKPLLGTQSNGRFIAYLNGFVDPETLKDQYITINGTLKKSEKGKIDSAEYTYPVLQSEHYRIWKLGQEYVYPYDDDYLYPFWRRPMWYAEPRLEYYLY